jgi:TRAP-type uncharacterized transport system fused permease subunit
VDLRRRFFTFSRARLINTVIAAVAFTLTEMGRDVYRPYVYSHHVNDFGIADTMGNHLGTLTIVFFSLAVSHANRRDGLVMMVVIVLGLVLYEFVQELMRDSTFDWRDVVATLIGGAVSVLIYLAVHRVKEGVRDA